MIEQIASTPVENFLNNPPDKLLKRTHPEDLPSMFVFTKF